jgi:hypothetical protein
LYSRKRSSYGISAKPTLQALRDRVDLGTGARRQRSISGRAASIQTESCERLVDLPHASNTNT